MSDDIDLVIVYDAECPFCNVYVRMLRLRSSVGEVLLLNARETHPIVTEIHNLGFDLNQGMIAKLAGQFYHGSDCMHLLALMSTRLGIFNRLVAWVFRNRYRARFVYPALRSIRNATLMLLGREMI